MAVDGRQQDCACRILTTNNNGTTASNTSDDHKDFAVVRLTAIGGAQTTTFDSDGKVTTDIGSRAGAAGNVANTDDRDQLDHRHPVQRQDRGGRVQQTRDQR